MFKILYTVLCYIYIYIYICVLIYLFYFFRGPGGTGGNRGPGGIGGDRGPGAGGLMVSVGDPAPMICMLPDRYLGSR